MKQKRLVIVVSAVVGGALIIGLLFGIIHHFHGSNKSVSNDVSVQRTASSAPVATPISADYKLLFMGDTMLARTVGSGIIDGHSPYQYVQSTLNNYDIRLANVETTIADPALSSKEPGKLYNFNAPVQAIQTLKQANVNVAMLANNHSRDFGPAATANMIDLIRGAGLSVAGAGKNVDEAFQPLIVNVPSASSAASAVHPTLRLAIIAVNSIENNFTNATATEAGSAYFDKDRITAAINTAKQTDHADVVIVVPHWGIEYQTQPTADQVSWGHFFIDSGADMVIGSHPHVIQPTETYNGKSIVYSMGNFIFDGMSGDALRGQMIGVTVHLDAKADAQKKLIADSQTIKVDPPTSTVVNLNGDGYPVPQ